MPPLHRKIGYTLNASIDHMLFFKSRPAYIAGISSSKAAFLFFWLKQITETGRTGKFISGFYVLCLELGLVLLSLGMVPSAAVRVVTWPWLVLNLSNNEKA
ncbi:hypothetical protein ACH5RR_004005 [Cinchona calisaya]|uniref:Uncharacterized protein n=1 Tax=Cinchona calisaya TaxID=153742 RepID=A0ABD3AWD1_9GENT